MKLKAKKKLIVSIVAKKNLKKFDLHSNKSKESIETNSLDANKSAKQTESFKSSFFLLVALKIKKQQTNKRKRWFLKQTYKKKF